MISKTPKPPYYAVIFTSQRAEANDGYEIIANQMLNLAQKQSGFLGAESVRDANGFGLTVSYWENLESIRKWREHPDHLKAQKAGKDRFYKDFKIRISKVERD
jgi:heme-degrading monooxygenase HmoA